MAVQFFRSCSSNLAAARKRSFVISIGITSTASFSLAMESQGQMAGSASALLGLLPFLLGAVTSPLVGIAGEYSAVPMGVIILSTSLLAMLAYLG